MAISQTKKGVEEVAKARVPNLMLTNHSKFDKMCNLIEIFYSQFFLSSKESLFGF